jgi:hypothetical protein
VFGVASPQMISQSSQCNRAPKTDTGPRSRLKAGLAMNW